MKTFKIRCSAIGQIMGKLSGGITDIQLKKLDTLTEKSLTDKGLTAKQKEEWNDLISKRSEPKSLPKTCITYLEQWVKEIHFGWHKQLNTNAINKGLICEDEAIAMLIKGYNLNYGEKNLLYFENEYLTGTPDLIYPDRVYDTKCSESPDTFPIFETSEIRKYNFNYWAQGMGYMSLTGIHYYSVVYAMCNTPEELLQKEIHYSCLGMSSSAREDKELEIRMNHNFDHVPVENRLKRFDFAYDPDYMRVIEDRVKLCRTYIKDVLLPKLNVT